LLQLHSHVNASTKNTDSLERALTTCNDPTRKVSILLRLAQENKVLDHPRALACALQAYEISAESGNDEGKLNSMIDLIWLYYTATDYTRALDYAYRSKDLADKLGLQKELAVTLDALGAIYDDFGDKDKGSEYYFRSLKIYERLNDTLGMAQSSSRIGVLYYKQKNYPKALEYLFKSLNLARKTTSHDGVASNLNSIANVYADQNDFKKALKNYMEGLSIAVEKNDLRMEGSLSLSIGTTYLKMRDYRLSMDYFQKALGIFIKLNNHLRITRCQVKMGEYYLAIHNFPKGIEFAGLALEKSRQLGFKEVELSAAQLLHQLSLAMKDTLQAYHYAMLESLLKDSLSNGEKQKNLTKLEAQYQFDKEQASKAIAQQRMDFIIIIMMILLISGMIILLLIWARQKVKARNAILKKESLEKELTFKNKEMVINVMSLMKKNEMLADLSEKLIKIDNEATTPEGKDTIKKVAKELQKSQEDEIWSEFSLRFKEVHGEFYDKLLQKYPGLSPNELKLCAFLRLNMSSKDIAALTGQRVSSLETARYRLRQKLGISNADVNLITFLSQV
jgi:tetratricopeptide (TPR) repeat protein/DNA-binding CsgD family transcriptional regulator